MNPSGSRPASTTEDHHSNRKGEAGAAAEAGVRRAATDPGRRCGAAQPARAVTTRATMAVALARADPEPTGRGTPVPRYTDSPKWRVYGRGPPDAVATAAGLLLQQSTAERNGETAPSGSVSGNRASIGGPKLPSNASLGVERRNRSELRRVDGNQQTRRMHDSRISGVEARFPLKSGTKRAQLLSR